MKETTVIYPHQVFNTSPAITAGRHIYLVEESLLLTRNPIHRSRLLLHKVSMDAYERKLVAAGHEVTRLTIDSYPSPKDVFTRIKDDGFETVHIVDTTDYLLEKSINTSGLKRVWYESPLFILEKDEACERFITSKRFMASFYKSLRNDKNILIDEDGKPTGGKWSFDEDNQKSIPKSQNLPEDMSTYNNEETKEAAKWVELVKAETYGEATCWLPYTHDGAEEFLQEFFRTVFPTFGPYEDAIHTDHTKLWHSTISPLLNIGLLEPQHVLDAALVFAENNEVPLQSLEGFVRQILGWREFIRASYECDGSAMRTKNHFSHTRSLTPKEWVGETDLLPFDHSTATTLKYGYTHHIERLMVLGNYFLLTGTHPDEVYRWFMGMYIDAYDWVMVPNVYGMSQFADGGSFATKPYISGANYLKKMSNYPTGEWEETWTALYWHFIARHRSTFENNHRMRMMVSLLDRMDTEKKKQVEKRATTFIATLSEN